MHHGPNTAGGHAPAAAAIRRDLERLIDRLEDQVRSEESPSREALSGLALLHAAQDELEAEWDPEPASALIWNELHYG